MKETDKWETPKAIGFTFLAGFMGILIGFGIQAQQPTGISYAYAPVLGHNTTVQITNYLNGTDLNFTTSQCITNSSTVLSANRSVIGSNGVDALEISYGATANGSIELVAYTSYAVNGGEVLKLLVCDTKYNKKM